MADPLTAMIVMDVAMIGLSMAMAPHLTGPRLDDLSVSLADYGTPIPRIWGKRKIQPQIFWADTLREVETTEKTKGGKYTQYKYYGTWAVLLCDHEIDAVTKICFDKRLVYDVTRAGPISLAAMFGKLLDSDSQKLSVGTNMKVYLGTEDQQPDPTIEAWCEDRYGPNTCPAYKGSAYIKFLDIPLEQAGNRIPQIAVEVVNNKVASYPFEVVNTDWGVELKAFSSDASLAYLGSSAGTMILDLATRQVIVELPDLDVFAQPSHAINADGSWIAGSYANTKTAQISASGLVTILSDDYLGPCWNVAAGTFGGDRRGGTDYVLQLVGSSVVTIPASFFPSWCFDDVDGGSWATGPADSGPGIYFKQLPDGTETFVSTSTTGGGTYALDNGNGGFFVRQGNDIYVIDKATMTVTHGPVATTYASDGGGFDKPFRGVLPGDSSIWIGFTRYSTTNCTVLQTETPANWGTSATSAGAIYSRVLNALITKDTNALVIRYLDRVGSNGVTLQTIVDEVSEWCGLTDRDTSQLTQTVYGYSVTQGTGKDMIAPLLDIHDVDARPHDFTVQFVNRGGAPTGSVIETSEFVRDGSEPRYKVTIQQDTDLPRRLTFNFADEGKNQQPNNVIAQRPLDAMNSTREETVDLSTYVDTPSAAQQKADRYLRRMWNSRERTQNALTAQYLELEPGDVKTVSLDGTLRNVRLDKLTRAQGVLQCEWVRDEINFAALNGRTGPEQDGRDDEVITIPAAAQGFVIDAPLIQDADNDVNPVLYYAAGSYGGTWAGASAYDGSDGSYDTLIGTIDSTHGATWGFTTSALGSVPSPWLWDRGNSFNATVYGGTLTSHTETEIDADPTLNLIALGVDGRWEYLQFATATLTGTSATANTYTLSGFKRGRRGTEGNTGNHTTADYMVVLENAAATQLGTDEIGDALSYKIQSIGRPIASAAPIDLTYDANTLKPYAPARIKWTTDGTDMFGEIIRRTRVGGSWNGGSTIPLSENSEEYEVDILDGSDNVLRTITLSGTNTFTYTGAQIAADGNTVGVPPTLNAYQMSDTAGRGFALAA
jgi:hypothetical protein